MRTIWKYNLYEGVNRLRMPYGYKVLSVKEQFNGIVLYCLVEDSKEKLDACFEVIGTGQVVRFSENTSDFVDTVFTDGGQLSYHVFHRVRKAV